VPSLPIDDARFAMSSKPMAIAGLAPSCAITA
jgi:hypothetical protein